MLLTQMQFLITRGLTWDRYLYFIHKLGVNGYDPYDRDTFIISDWTSEDLDEGTYSMVDTINSPQIHRDRPVIILTGTSNYGRNMARGIGAKRALAIALTREYGHRYCIMMDDNISIVDMSSYQVASTGRSIRYQIGPNGPYVGSPISPDVASRMKEAQGRVTTLGALSSMIMECPLWDTNPRLVLMGCTRVDHTGQERDRYIDPSIPCSGTQGWSIHKYLVMDVTRMEGTNFDPILTVMGEDVLLFGNLAHRGLQAHKLYNIMIHREEPLPMPIPEAPPVTINADDFYARYLSSPMLVDGRMTRPIDQEDMIDVLSGEYPYILQYGNAFRIRSYLPPRVSIVPEFPVNPYIRATALSGVPMTSNSGLGVEGTDYSLRTTWKSDIGNTYTACREPQDDAYIMAHHIDTYHRVPRDHRIWYNYCLPSYMHLGQENRYNERWRFLILYGMIRYANDVSLMRDMFHYYHHRGIGISFSSSITQIMAKDNPNPDIRERCRPFLYPSDVDGRNIPTSSIRCTGI